MLTRFIYWPIGVISGKIVCLMFPNKTLVSLVFSLSKFRIFHGFCVFRCKQTSM